VETPYTGLFVPQKGVGANHGPKEMADLAREIISGLTEKEEVDDLPLPATGRSNPGCGCLRQADPGEITGRALWNTILEESVYVVPSCTPQFCVIPKQRKSRCSGVWGIFQRIFSSTW